jgi:hypothetical protein
MGESEICEQPKNTSISEDLYSAGSHLWNAVWKINEVQAKAVVGAAQTVGQFVEDHPAEVIVTASTGLPGLAVMKGGQELYAENKDDIAPVMNEAACAGQALLTEATQISMDSSRRLADNFREKPLTMAAEFLINPVLPAFHSLVSAAIKPEAQKPG